MLDEFYGYASIIGHLKTEKVRRKKNTKEITQNPELEVNKHISIGEYVYVHLCDEQPSHP